MNFGFSNSQSIKYTNLPSEPKTGILTILENKRFNNPRSSWENFILALFENNSCLRTIDDLPRKEGNYLVIGCKSNLEAAVNKIKNSKISASLANLKNNPLDFKAYEKYGTFQKLSEIIVNCKDWNRNGWNSHFQKIYLYRFNEQDLMDLYDLNLFSYDKLFLVDFKW